MIEPKQSDIGRNVIYKPKHSNDPKDEEVGYITSFNKLHAFVRFGNDAASKACLWTDLQWELVTTNEDPIRGDEAEAG